MARISLDEVRSRASTVDRARVDAASGADLFAQCAADPDAPRDVPAALSLLRIVAHEPAMALASLADAPAKPEPR